MEIEDQCPAGKKHIAIIIDTLLGGGAEKVMITLANTLNEMGHHAFLIVLSKEVDHQLPTHCAVHFLYSEPTRLKGRRNCSRHVAALRELVASLENEYRPIDLFLVNLEESYRIVADCYFERSYYVIHNSMVSTLKRTRLLGPLKYFYFKHILRKLDNKDLICVSKGVENEIKNTGIIKARSMRTIYNPHNIDAIRKLSLVNIPDIPKHPYIIHVGRAARQKRHDVLFRAMQFVDQDVSLVCLSSNTKKLRSLAIKYGVSDRVILPGFQKNPYPWIARAKVLALSSDYEGFAMVLTESLICGTTPVATKCPHGPSEILTGYLDSLLAQPGNPEDLAEKINLALKTRIDLKNAEILQHVHSEHIARQYLSLTGRRVEGSNT